MLRRLRALFVILPSVLIVPCAHAHPHGQPADSLVARVLGSPAILAGLPSPARERGVSLACTAVPVLAGLAIRGARWPLVGGGLVLGPAAGYASAGLGRRAAAGALVRAALVIGAFFTLRPGGGMAIGSRRIPAARLGGGLALGAAGCAAAGYDLMRVAGDVRADNVRVARMRLIGTVTAAGAPALAMCVALP